MELRLAREQEFLQVRGLYWDIIDQMARAEYRPGWKKGIYPSDQWIRAALREGSLYTAREGDALIGPMALDHRSAEGYDRAAWGVDAAGGAVSVIHALGVLPAWQGRGAGKLLVRGALETARQNGQRAVRLDVLGTNLTAQKLYERVGFQYRGTLQLYYEDTGLTDFRLYEYIL